MGKYGKVYEGYRATLIIRVMTMKTETDKKKSDDGTLEKKKSLNIRYEFDMIATHEKVIRKKNLTT